MSQYRTGTLLVIGLGLIGGSLAAALRGSGFAERIIAWNRSRAGLEYAVANDLIDAAPQTVEEAIAAADLIVVGVPTLSVEKVFDLIREHARPGVVITDVASVKGRVLDAARRVFGEVPAAMVPGHPIAGAEHSGVEASRRELFEGRRVILTPTAETSGEALQLVGDMWRLTGAEVLSMDAAEHDRVLAMTSHLPHVLAFTLVDALARDARSEDIFRYAAGGFRDFTRIASSDVVMWRDIALANRDELIAAMDLFAAHLAELRGYIEAGDAERIAGLFANARAARESYLHWLEQGIVAENLK